MKRIYLVDIKVTPLPVISKTVVWQQELKQCELIENSGSQTSNGLRKAGQRKQIPAQGRMQSETNK